MPYIPQDKRELIDEGPGYITNAGEFNYYISSLINNYISYNGKSYALINEMIGVLECAKLELYRRVAAPYEDIKIQQNGDVYTV